MPRTFAYLRVSTPGQTTDNQLTEIQAAGFTIEPRRLVTETVSGSTAVGQRRGFARLLDRLGRSLPHLLEVMGDLRKRGIAFRSLTEAMDTATRLKGKLQLSVSAQSSAQHV